MLIVIIIILLILMSIGIYLCDKLIDSGIFLINFSGVFGMIAVFALIVILIIYPYNCDKKLAMYEEENIKIETKVKETVRAYMNYEEDIYINLVETLDLTTLLTKYPELNSNKLIEMEIKTYKENTIKIKELKREQINRSSMRWWLYFGK